MKVSKTRALLTGVESGDFIDPEGNLVSVDDDFSRAAEVHDLVKQALKIEMQKIETDADYKAEEKVDRAFITRRMNKSSILTRIVQGVFRFVLYAHCFITVHEWGSVELCM